MELRLLPTALVASTILILFTQTGFAQTGMQQQMPGYTAGGSNAPAAGKNQTDIPAVSPNSDLRIVPSDFAKLKLAPGFLLGLNVLDDSDFAGSYRIDGQGNIALPIIGLVHLEGETAGEATTQIKKALLDQQILRDPQVSLSVLEYSAPEVTLLGEVASPGKYPLLAPRKLVDVLALAGGPTVIAGNQVQIISGGAETQPVLVRYSKDSDPKLVEDVLVQPGDTVLVKRAGIVYILGAVNRPGGYVMQEDGTLNILQAMSLALGTNIAASTKTVFLLRRNPDGTEVDIALPYKKISEGKSADVQLHATDVLYVPTSTVKAIFTNSQSILSSATSASIYAAAIH